MPSCLGLYIEKNLIKYAKVTKDHDLIKVDSFDVKFYDKISEAISQIIEETYSYKIPICINLSDEMYNYFQVFSLLNKNDIPKAIETEFESLCDEKEYDRNALEARNVIIANLQDREKLRVIHVAANKSEINSKVQMLDGNKVGGIVPVPMSLPNLIDAKAKENVMIVNIEEKTTLTTILDNNVYNVEVLEEGSKKILDSINAKENSYSKAYNICKNTTIYTTSSQDLQIDTDSNDYLDDIMPTLFNILSKVKNAVENSAGDIEKVYITGTGAVINNIDLYFSEYLGDIKCEILKPYFISTGLKNINIKDYIQVNSAISLALNYLGVGISGMNFKKTSISEKINEIMNIQIGGAKKLKEKSTTKEKKKSKKITLDFNFDLTGELDSIEKILLRIGTSLLGLIIIFIIFSSILTNQMKSKEADVDEVIADANTQISNINRDNDKINSKITSYQELIDNLNKTNEALAEKYSLKDAIPNLLNQIMYIIPKDVQVISIENTNSKHIKIVAQSEKYEQLGYFKGQIKNEGLLLNVTSDQGVKNGDVVKITIEGELP